jgi:hypothetical protein
MVHYAHTGTDARATSGPPVYPALSEAGSTAGPDARTVSS